MKKRNKRVSQMKLRNQKRAFNKIAKDKKRRRNPSPAKYLSVNNPYGVLLPNVEDLLK